MGAIFAESDAKLKALLLTDNFHTAAAADISQEEEEKKEVPVKEIVCQKDLEISFLKGGIKIMNKMVPENPDYKE